MDNLKKKGQPATGTRIVLYFPLYPKPGLSCGLGSNQQLRDRHLNNLLRFAVTAGSLDRYLHSSYRSHRGRPLFSFAYGPYVPSNSCDSIGARRYLLAEDLEEGAVKAVFTRPALFFGPLLDESAEIRPKQKQKKTARERKYRNVVSASNHPGKQTSRQAYPYKWLQIAAAVDTRASKGT